MLGKCVPHVLGHLLQGAIHHHDSNRVRELRVQLLVAPAEGANLLHDLFYCSQCVIFSEVIQRAPDQTICASHDTFTPARPGCRRCGTICRRRLSWRCGTAHRNIAAKANQLVALPVVKGQGDGIALSNPLLLLLPNDMPQHLGHSLQPS